VDSSLYSVRGLDNERTASHASSNPGFGLQRRKAPLEVEVTGRGRKWTGASALKYYTRGTERVGLGVRMRWNGRIDMVVGWTMGEQRSNGEGNKMEI
jgi:hypothetical protein